MSMERIRDRERLQIVLADSTYTYMLLVHSPLCAVSAVAFREYERWAMDRPETGTGWIDADEDRDVAGFALGRLPVACEVPTAIYVRRGQMIWWASSEAITRASLGSAFGQPSPARSSGGGAVRA
jgi:bacillithiol system protein YtxJ